MTDPYSGFAYGTVILSIPEEYLRSLYWEHSNPENRTDLVDANGNVVSSSNRNLVSTLLSEQAHTFLLGPHSASVFGDGKRSYVYLKAPLQRAGLTLIQRIPVEELQGDVYSLRDRVFVIFAITLLISIYCAFFVARQISFPLMRLRNRILSTNGISAPSNRAAIDNRPTKWYFSEYNSLIDNLEDTVNQLVHEQKEKRKAEIHALQMQINPHFLFNTLKSLKCLVWTQRYQRIEPTINALIRLLQHTLRDTDELETLDVQLSQLKEFVYIQEVRLDHEVNVTYQCSETARLCRMPKLILQPIVENAIVHGIESKIETGRIWVNGTVLDGDLLMEVIDNGVGCAQSRVDEILCESSPETHGIWTRHIGLRNVSARLHTLFGPGYDVNFRTKEGAGTSVTVRFPAIT